MGGILGFEEGGHHICVFVETVVTSYEGGSHEFIVVY